MNADRGVTRRIATSLLLAAVATLTMAARADLGPLDALVLPGKVIKGHAALENDCKNCHTPFKKSAQRDLCLACHDHRAVAQDIAAGRGYHGRLKDNTCSVCHTDHKGRDVDIVKLDEARFDHKATDFALRGAHAAAKVKCRDCHSPGAKFRDAPSDCHVCHKKDDIHKGGLGKTCVNCHDDVSWKNVRFDHSKTDYPLDGRHIDVECKACHVDNRYKATPKDCYSCHRGDDDKKGHKGRFGKKCQSCHVTEGWTLTKFDHKRDTKYPLLGKHARAKCSACHTGDLYQQKLGTACIACHERDDTHKGRFGKKCESCHNERDWTGIRFDHDRDTKYPLLGKHRPLKCDACHKDDAYKEKLGTACIACHLQDDAHKGQEGKKCESCHSEHSWTKAVFDHGLSRFPLLGKHAKVECKACHKQPTFKDASTKCLDCHEKDDSHKRRLGQACEQCHNARDWKQWSFNHNERSQFRLDGAHERLDCHACHRQPVKHKIELAGGCVSCHEADDVHAGSYGAYCERCHFTSSFKQIKTRMRTLQ
ncbi:MAG: cytochrome C [Gammaproteobacteria bacterium]|nr:cytochrome C [Gammaproteobacteria bacterium]